MAKKLPKELYVYICDYDDTGDPIYAVSTDLHALVHDAEQPIAKYVKDGNDKEIKVSVTLE